jgi:hypothetical protein
MFKHITIAGLAIVALGSTWSLLAASKDAAEEEVRLLGMLQDQWQYPGSKFSGASMQDTMNPAFQLVKCQAVLTMPDSVEKVVNYYQEKLPTIKPVGSTERKAETDGKRAVSVSEQDDSKDRPVQLHVFFVNQAMTFTTLVISRAEGEKETHIAWTQLMRFADKR